MSISAALVLAAAAAQPQVAQPAHRVVQVQARVSATILPAAIVRQASGLQEAPGTTPGHQLNRRGTTILVEFE